MQEPFDHDPSADPIEPVDLPPAENRAPTPIGDPLADDRANAEPVELSRDDPPDEAVAPSVTPDAGAAQRRIRMQLYSRMMTDLQVLTGDKRMATDTEIDEALTRAARALGVWQPARQEAVWQRPMPDPLNGEMAPPRLQDAAVFKSEEPRSESAMSGLDVGTPVDQAQFDAVFGNPPMAHALDSSDAQPSQTLQRGNAGNIYSQLAKPIKDYNKIRLGPKDMAYQRNLIPFDNDIIENNLLFSGRRRKELEKMIEKGKTDDIISSYFQIEYSSDFTSKNPLRAEAHSNLIASLRLLVGTGVGRRLLLNMAYKGTRQKAILSPVGETQAISGEGSAILFNFRQVGEVKDLPGNIPQIYRMTIAIAHELGHSILGYSDPARMRNANPPNMSVFMKMSKSQQKNILDTVLPNTMGDSVEYVENAIREELNVIPRKSYIMEKNWRPFYDVYEKGK